MHRLTAAIFGWFFLACTLCAGTPFDPEKDVTVALQAGAVIVTVPQGAHLKAAFMTVGLKPGTPGTLKVGPLPRTDAKDELGDGIWHGRVAIPVAGTGLPPALDLMVTYQPCTEGEGGVCYPPTERDLRANAADIPSPAAASGPARRNLFWLFMAAFGFGLAASLTPCVYPMIAITMAIIGAKGGGKARGLALSAALVAGMAVTYTALGVLAAVTGAAFGATSLPYSSITLKASSTLLKFALISALSTGLFASLTVLPLSERESLSFKSSGYIALVILSSLCLAARDSVNIFGLTSTNLAVSSITLNPSLARLRLASKSLRYLFISISFGAHLAQLLLIVSFLFVSEDTFLEFADSEAELLVSISNFPVIGIFSGFNF